MSDAAGAAEAPVAPTVRELALTFSTLAFESFGGGLAAWVQRVVVEEKRWLTEEEYLSASTICGILPGANQVNMAVFVGTRFRGGAGAFAAVGGLLAGPALVALVLGALYLRFRGEAAVRHALSGMSCAAAGLTLSVAWKQGVHVMTAAAPIILAAVTFALSAVLRVPLWLTVAGLAPIGFLWAWRHRCDGASAETAP
jgi:chromate transporter